MGDLDPSNNGFLGPPESPTQTEFRSVRPFVQGSLTVADRQTDRRRYSVGITIDRIYVRSTGDAV